MCSSLNIILLIKFAKIKIEYSLGEVILAHFYTYTTNIYLNYWATIINDSTLNDIFTFCCVFKSDGR